MTTEQLKRILDKKMHRAHDKADNICLDNSYRTYNLGKYSAYEDIYALLCEPNEDEEYQEVCGK